MLRWSIWLAGASVALASMSTEALARDQSAKIQNFDAPGNLESDYNLGCIVLKDAKPLYNPVDLFKATKACIIADRYDDAVSLFALAGAYGRYDILRVADPTSHQAIAVARMEILGDLPDADSQKFQVTASTLFGDIAKKSDLCVEINRIGPPSYFPRYMVQHGMTAFFGRSTDGLVKNFDGKSAWTDVFSIYLKCKHS